MRELRAILARLDLAETSEHHVMEGRVAQSDLLPRLDAVLAADERWR